MVALTILSLIQLLLNIAFLICLIKSLADNNIDIYIKGEIIFSGSLCIIHLIQIPLKMQMDKEIMVSCAMAISWGLITVMNAIFYHLKNKK